MTACGIHRCCLLWRSIWRQDILVHMLVQWVHGMTLHYNTVYTNQLLSSIAPYQCTLDPIKKNVHQWNKDQFKNGGLGRTWSYQQIAGFPGKVGWQNHLGTADGDSIKRSSILVNCRRPTLVGFKCTTTSSAVRKTRLWRPNARKRWTTCHETAWMLT